MENQTPITPVNSQHLIAEPKQNNFLVILLSILLFISLVIAGFFAYQTQKLTGELRMKNEELRITTPTPESVATKDPTTDWKTYTNDKYKFSFLYPNELQITVNQSDTSDYVQLIFEQSSVNFFFIKAWVNYPLNQSKYLNDSKPVGSKSIAGTTWDIYMLSADEGLQTEKNKVLYSVVYPNSRTETVNQILSTFKFTN